MKSKAYNNFSDKFGNEYSFDSYAEFAKFWFAIPYRRQLEYFPKNRAKLQNAAANSKEARTRL